ncbi:MAG TPA: hypothetical protein VN914_05265 [Polyangia bacterium]|nr:hypothetical protein [Polyangia bacterium]
MPNLRLDTACLCLALTALVPACSSSSGGGSPDAGDQQTPDAAGPTADTGAAPDAAAPALDTMGTPMSVPGTCGKQAGACVNAADCSKNRTEVEAKVQECARGCFGVGQCTAKCVREAFGLTAACAQCWGDVVQCGRDKCLGPCTGGSETAACRSCTAMAGCDQGFATCSGL